MGKKKYVEKIIEFIEITPAFTARDIEVLTGSKEYAHLTLHNMVSRGIIHRLVKNCYSKYGDPTYIVYCYRPAYIGLEDALSIHGLWSQETIPVVVTPRKIRTGIRNVTGYNVFIRRIDPRYFFGYEYIRYNRFYIPVSEIEKTLIDMAYYNRYIPEEVFNMASDRVDRQKLLRYLNIYPHKIRKRIIYRLKHLI